MSPHAEPLGVADSDTFFADCPIPARVFEFRGWVHRVKDGDTCVLWADEGDGHMAVYPVRYEHVNCPEDSAAKREPGGPEATEFNRSLVSEKWVTFVTRKRRDQNGRFLGTVYLYQGAHVGLVDVTKTIIDAGHGVRRT